MTNYLNEVAEKMALNKSIKENMTQEQLDAIDLVLEKLGEALSMIFECQDLYISDVRELDIARNKLRNAFDSQPSEWQLEQFKENGIAWDEVKND